MRPLRLALPEGVRLGFLSVDALLLRTKEDAIACPSAAILPTRQGKTFPSLHNREYAEKWPNITAKKSAPPPFRFCSVAFTRLGRKVLIEFAPLVPIGVRIRMFSPS
jgi:hypothetical protein